MRQQKFIDNADVYLDRRGWHCGREEGCCGAYMGIFAVGTMWSIKRLDGVLDSLFTRNFALGG